MADVKKLAEELVNLKVTEVNELATILKEEYGIEPAAAAVAVAAPAAGAGVHEFIQQNAGKGSGDPRLRRYWNDHGAPAYPRGSTRSGGSRLVKI